jgi:hypothetical protein
LPRLTGTAGTAGSARVARLPGLADLSPLAPLCSRTGRSVATRRASNLAVGELEPGDIERAAEHEDLHRATAREDDGVAARLDCHVERARDLHWLGQREAAADAEHDLAAGRRRRVEGRL